jgi:hypothetical protein
MLLTLGFQTILPAQIALMSARGVNTPLGWYIVSAQMVGVLLAFMLVAGLVAALRYLLGEKGAGPGAGIWRSSTASSRCAWRDFCSITWCQPIRESLPPCINLYQPALASS